MDEADEDLLRSDDLKAALDTLNSTASKLYATAENMTNLTGLATNFDRFVGFVDGAINTLQGIQKVVG